MNILATIEGKRAVCGFPGCPFRLEFRSFEQAEHHLTQHLRRDHNVDAIVRVVGGKIEIDKPEGDDNERSSEEG